jgi:hypothetical protein
LTERVCYGIELDPKYVDLVVTRFDSQAGITREGWIETWGNLHPPKRATPPRESPEARYGGRRNSAFNRIAALPVLCLDGGDVQAIFLRRLPDKNPRTLCACQPVAFIRALRARDVAHVRPFLGAPAVCAPDSAVRQKILVDNPARLYGF